ncbi:MAG: hypothetical protein CMK07_12165 [Ponticaulis sp.]|nr:hypothetical protein [Ponticaulis sp.]
MLRRSEFYQPDLSVLSEVKLDMLPAGNVIAGGENWGYPAKSGQRKIALVAEAPWEDVRAFDERPLAGRYVEGRTCLSGRETIVIGVCIPWSFCHVTHGFRDRSRWQEHKDFLRALRPRLLKASETEKPIIFGGDFNHTFPPDSMDAEAHQMLLDLLSEADLALFSSGQSKNGRLLNHLAGRGFELADTYWISKVDGDRDLTDHNGICVDLREI